MDFGVARILVDVEVGVFWEFGVDLSGSGGLRENSCNNDDCFFGSISATSNLGLRAELQAIVCTESIWTAKDCTGLSITPLAVSASLTGSLQWEMPECGDGFNPEVFVGQITFAGEFSVTDLGSLTIEYFTISGFRVL